MVAERWSATLVLEDGTTFYGASFGAPADAVFELVFNTSMTGYQEIITDPSYRGQGVLFTTAHIGNVGVNAADVESERPQVEAVVVHSLSRTSSNWRAERSLPDWLAEHGVPGIAGIDTRAITRKLRDQGTMKAALSTCGTSPEVLLAMARSWPGLDGRDMVGEVTCQAPYEWRGDAGTPWVGEGDPAGVHLVAMDFGIKRNILRHLARCGARVTVVPAYTSLSEVLALQPDGVFLSNGPGDPAGLPGIVEVVGGLIESGLPVFGICLGQQLIGRALGGRTSRLKFGHHSGNHPVKDILSGKVLITAQNHNYAVDLESLPPHRIEATHISLNDRTLEGFALSDRPVFCVQFHPEASPGPHDAHGLFDRFFTLVTETSGKKEVRNARA